MANLPDLAGRFIQLQGGRYYPCTGLYVARGRVLSLDKNRRSLMFVTSRYLNGGAPTCCYNCQEPYKLVDNHYTAWHGKDNHYYCGEDCEADTLEANARRAKVFS